MTLLCERCGAEVSPDAAVWIPTEAMLCPSCAKRAGVGQGDEHPALAALRETRRGTRVDCWQAIDAAIPQLEALLAERNRLRRAAEDFASWFADNLGQEDWLDDDEDSPDGVWRSYVDLPEYVALEQALKPAAGEEGSDE